ncbi:hypothetical protein DFP73DRAFT_483820 [Morchella snyderi]|nr:hypothetical protein DFP73DRAFT_483820 [Morchella snyderi]
MIGGLVGGSAKPQQQQQPSYGQQQGHSSSGSGSGSGLGGMIGGLMGGSKPQQQQQQQSSGGWGDKLHGMIGGGPESEKKEDAVDKAVDLFQEHILKQGPQNNESAFEQAKDAQIGNFIRSQYKTYTGKDIPKK